MLITLLVAGAALALVLILHYWTLWALAFLTPADDAGNHKRSLEMLLLLASSHVAHIAIYPALYYALVSTGGWGGFKGGADTASTSSMRPPAPIRRSVSPAMRPRVRFASSPC